MNRALCLALFLAALARAGDEPVRFELTPDQIPESLQESYGIYSKSDNKKIGYVITRIKKGRTSIEYSDEMLMKMKSMGQDVEVSIFQSQIFAGEAPFGLVKGSMRMGQGAVRQTVEVERTEKGLHAKIEAAGSVREMDLGPVDYTLADLWTQRAWFQGGPRKVGETLTVREFQLMDLQPSTNTLKILEVKESLVSGVAVTFYEVSHTSLKSGTVGPFRHETSGRIISGLIGGMFEFRLEPEEVAKKLEEGGDLFVFGAVKLDKPIGKPTTVVELVVEVLGDVKDKLRSGPQQSVEREGEKTILRLGIAHGVEERPTEEEVARNLEETVEFPIKHEKVVKLAAEAVGDAETDRKKTARLILFVKDFLKDAIRPEPVPVLHLIETPNGDCTEHAQLFVTLARASGIPARTAAGLMYMGDKIQAFGPHAWAEVVLDGRWVPVDPAWKETEVDAAHIRFGAGDKGNLQMATAFGQFGLKLISVETK
jgi:hypothetical protein